MKFTSFVARRYLKSSQEHRFFSWVSFLSVFAVAIGVAAPIVVLSVIGGFQKELRFRFLAANAHILAYKFPDGIRDYDNWEKSFLADYKKNLTGTAPFIHSETMARNGSQLISVLVRGIHPLKREKVQSLKRIVKPQQALTTLQQELETFAKRRVLPDVPSIIVGAGVLKRLELKVGEVIYLVSPTDSSMDSLRTFRIVGTYDSGFYHYDNKIALLSIPAAQSFFGMKSHVTGVEIGLKEPDQSISLANEIRKKHRASRLIVKPWQTFNTPLFDAMEKEKAVIAIIVFLVIAVASFNILTSLFISVSQKQREISILKSIGASNKQVLGIFLKQGFYTGIIGSAAGLFIAFGLCKILENFKIIDLPELYLLAKLPVLYDVQLFLGVAAAGIAVCTLAGIPPAIFASRTQPTEGFRNTAA